MARATENEEFWRDEFTVTPEIEQTLQNAYLEGNQPLTVSAITQLLMRWEHEKHALPQNTGIYNPVNVYQVDDSLSFPMLDSQQGQVTAIRAGNNPRYGDFSVITVRFADGSEREFATNLDRDNADQIDMVEEPPMALDALVDQFGPLAQEEVAAALEASENFVTVGHEWLPAFMLVAFHDGHLNIVDAMIDIMATPLSTEELLKEIPLEEEASAALKRFSLDYALGRNENFVNQGQNGQASWYLTRLSG